MESVPELRHPTGMDVLKRAVKQQGKYQNPVPTEMGGLSLALKVLPRYLRNQEETEPRIPLGPFRTDAAVFAEPPASGLRITWMGHAASLVEMDGVRVLLDPVWEPRASPFGWAGPKRFFAPTLPLEDLPELDAVLISHDHYDHLGADTMRRLSTMSNASRARWVTALGVGKRLQKFGVAAERITELDWTQGAEVHGRELGQSLTVTAWPARHFSGRGLFDRFSTLWGSYVLDGPKHRVLFGGDSGYWEGFRALGERYDRFDLVMLQVGAYDDEWKSIHMTPEDAVQAYQDLGGAGQAGLLMPIHWGLFNLALHGWRAPMERTAELAAAAGFPLWAPEPGVPTEVDGQEVQSLWWKAR